MKQFIVLKTIGQFGTSVVRSFDDLQAAQFFCDLLRKSEQHDFIKYSVAQMLDY